MRTLPVYADIEEIPKNIVIMDAQGKRLPVGAFIEPGSRIYLTASRVTVQGAVLNPGNFPIAQTIPSQTMRTRQEDSIR